MASKTGSTDFFPIGARSIESALATRHAYQKGGKGYVSFNGMKEVTSDSEPQSFLSLQDLLDNPYRPWMSSNEYPYAGLVLQDPSPKDHQMAKFLFQQDQVPFVKTVNDQGKSEYSLLKDTRDSLDRLEETLTRVVRFVEKVSPISQFRTPPLPSSLRYREKFDSYKRLCKYVMGTRRAFDLFFAFTVYVVTMRTDTGRLQRSGVLPVLDTWPKWCEKAFEEKKLRREHIKGFLFSQPFDFTSKRIGMFISPHTCTFVRDLHFFLQAGVPVTVIWNLDIGEQGLWSFGRLSKEVKKALEYGGNLWDSDSSMEWGQAVIKADRKDNAARVPSNVYDWKDFFSDREEETPVKFSGVNPNSNDYRQARHNAIHRDKYQQGSHVFLWEEFSKDPPLWKRTQIEGEMKNTKWDEHKPTERVYCEFRNEWDLCKPMVEGMPALPGPPLRPPSDSDSESDSEPQNGVILKVDDEDLRPYLRHPLWKERHRNRVKSKSSLNVECIPAPRLPSLPLRPTMPAMDPRRRIISHPHYSQFVQPGMAVAEDADARRLSLSSSIRTMERTPAPMVSIASSSSTALSPFDLTRKRKRETPEDDVPSSPQRVRSNIYHS